MNTAVMIKDIALAIKACEDKRGLQFVVTSHNEACDRNGMPAMKLTGICKRYADLIAALEVLAVEADKIEIAHGSALLLNAGYDRRCQAASQVEQNTNSRHREMPLSAVARLVKPVMVAAALMLSVPAVSFADVSFSDGQIVGKSGDTYSVKQPSGSIWSGVERSELTAQQIKGFDMTQAAQAARNQAVADRQSEADMRAIQSHMAAVNKKVGADKTAANQQRTEAQAVAKADAQQADADRQKRADADMHAIQSHMAAVNNQVGADKTAANQQRTQSQIEAGQAAADMNAIQSHMTAVNNQVGTDKTAANQQRTGSQADALRQAQADADMHLIQSHMAAVNKKVGADKTAANQQRTEAQAVAKADAQQADADRQKRADADMHAIQSHMAAVNNQVGADKTAANQQRTQSQIEAGQAAADMNAIQSHMTAVNNQVDTDKTAANQQRTGSQADALRQAQADADMHSIQSHMAAVNKKVGADKTAANQQRTEAQAVAKADAQQADADRQKRADADMHAIQSHMAAVNNQVGADKTAANQQRTQSQIEAGQAAADMNAIQSHMTAVNNQVGADKTAANQQRTGSQADALRQAQADADMRSIQSHMAAVNKKVGAGKTAANQQRTEAQAVAKADAQQADADRKTADKAHGDAMTQANIDRTASQAVALNAATDANSTINKDAGSLPSNTPVKTTDGKVTTAGQLPAQDQVSVAYNSAIFGSHKRQSNGGSSANGGEGSHGGTGNGGENAQASHSAGNFSTGHDHIGSGRSGGGFHY